MASALLTSSMKLLRRTGIFERTSSTREYERELQSCLDHFVRRWNTPISPGRVRLHDFEITRKIGKGSFGNVFLARCKESGREYALKVLPKEQIIDGRDLEYVRLEREIHRCISFKFIVTLICHFQDNANIFLCLEFVPGGDFFTLMQEVQQLDENEAKFYAAQILLALEYLHRVGVVYRDLKPENILVDAKGYLKISDLGFARTLASKAFTLCGTAEYFAPEMLSRASYGISVDYWAFGMFIHELIFGKTAFCCEGVLMFQRILHEKLAFPLGYHCSDEGRHLIKCLLKKSPRKRLTNAMKIKKHPWFRAVDFNEVYRQEAMAPIIPNCAMNSRNNECKLRNCFERSSRLLYAAEFADF